MRAQLLDAWNNEYGILNPLHATGEQPIAEYGAAFSSALNAWLVEHWLDPEPRLQASLSVPYEDGDLAAAEIEREAGDRRFVQMLLPARASDG